MSSYNNMHTSVVQHSLGCYVFPFFSLCVSLFYKLILLPWWKVLWALQLDRQQLATSCHSIRNCFRTYIRDFGIQKFAWRTWPQNYAFFVSACASMVMQCPGYNCTGGREPGTFSHMSSIKTKKGVEIVHGCTLRFRTGWVWFCTQSEAYDSIPRKSHVSTSLHNFVISI